MTAFVRCASARRAVAAPAEKWHGHPNLRRRPHAPNKGRIEIAAGFVAPEYLSMFPSIGARLCSLYVYTWKLRMCICACAGDDAMKDTGDETGTITLAFRAPRALADAAAEAAAKEGLTRSRIWMSASDGHAGDGTWCDMLPRDTRSGLNRAQDPGCGAPSLGCCRTTETVALAQQIMPAGIYRSIALEIILTLV
jgi:hypothetical protein